MGKDGKSVWPSLGGAVEGLEGVLGAIAHGNTASVGAGLAERLLPV